MDPIRDESLRRKLGELSRIFERLHKKKSQERLELCFFRWSGISSHKTQAAMGKILFNSRWSDLTSLWRLRVWFFSAKRKARREIGQRTQLGFEKLSQAFRRLQEGRWRASMKTIHRFVILVERETHIKRTVLRKTGDSPDPDLHRFGFELLALVVRYRLVSHFAVMKSLPEKSSKRIARFIFLLENLVRKKVGSGLRTIRRHGSNSQSSIDFLNYLAFFVRNRSLEISRKIFDRHRAFLIFKRTSHDTVIIANLINLAQRVGKSNKKRAFERWVEATLGEHQKRNDIRVAMTAYADELFYAQDRRVVKVEVEIEIDREEIAIELALFIKAFVLLKRTQLMKIAMVRMGARLLVQRLEQTQLHEEVVTYREEQTFSFV